MISLGISLKRRRQKTVPGSQANIDAIRASSCYITDDGSLGLDGSHANHATLLLLLLDSGCSRITLQQHKKRSLEIYPVCHRAVCFARGGGGRTEEESTHQSICVVGRSSNGDPSGPRLHPGRRTPPRPPQAAAAWWCWRRRATSSASVRGRGELQEDDAPTRRRRRVRRRRSRGAALLRRRGGGVGAAVPAGARRLRAAAGRPPLPRRQNRG